MRDLLLTAIVFGALPFILKRPWIGILVWSWLGYMNPHKQTWGFAYDFPFAQLVAIVTITAFVFSREKKEMVWTRETVLLLIFNGWLLFTTFFAFYPDDAWMQWDKVWKIQLVTFLTLMLIKDRRQLDWLIWVVVLSIGYYGVKGGIFTIATAGNYRVWGPQGTFIGGNNELALALIMLIPLIWYLHLQEPRKWIKFALLGGMLLCGVAAIGSQSRGGFLAIMAMGFFLWLKSRHKFSTAVVVLVAAGIVLTLMPQSWYERMHSIKEYEQDASAMGRINSWHTAFNIATERITGGGFEVLTRPATFKQFAPDPFMFADAHSIYFEVLGEHGFIGLGIFMLLALFVWLRANQIIRVCKRDPERKWAADLAAMLQVSLVGFGAGGAFLGLAYFDLPYHLMVMVILVAKFTGVLGNVTRREEKRISGVRIHPSSRWD